MSNIAKQIRLARKRLKMSQAQFAQELDASQGSVSKWESGREVPRIDTLQKIAQLVPEFQIAENPEVGALLLASSTRIRRRDLTMVTARVPIRGSFTDSFVPKPPSAPGLELVIPITEDWLGRDLEAWYIENYQEDRRTQPQTLGVFVLLGEDDRPDDLSTNERFLFSHDPLDGRGERYWLMSLETDYQTGHAVLWPTSRAGKRHIMPVPLTVDGKPTIPSSKVRGFLFCTLMYSSLSTPDNLEPT